MKVPRQKIDTSNERPRFLIKCMMEVPPIDATEWEESFVESLAEKLEGDPNYVFSEKQLEVLERIWAK